MVLWPLPPPPPGAPAPPAVGTEVLIHTKYSACARTEYIAKVGVPYFLCLEAGAESAFSAADAVLFPP